MSEGTEVIDIVRAALTANLPGTTIGSIEPLPGGHSGHTLLAELEPGGGRVVVKAGAPGRPAVGRHDVRRQARVLRAASGVPGFRVPELVLDVDGDPPIVAMAFVTGEAVEPVLDGVGGKPPAVIEARALGSARMLATLHGADPSALGLADEVPATVADELDRWEKTMLAVDPALVPGAPDLIAELRRSIPQEGPPVLVHGDYRLGNILCDGSEPVGAIDWEIWSLTDARIDLGWFLLFGDPDEFPSVGHPAPGMPTIAELLAAYESVAGPVADATWFLAFARMKMAAIMGHNLRRHREGRFHDPFQEQLPPTIAALVQRGLEALTTDGAPR